jgi:hypothetical protein
MPGQPRGPIPIRRQQSRKTETMASRGIIIKDQNHENRVSRTQNPPLFLCVCPGRSYFNGHGHSNVHSLDYYQYHPRDVYKQKQAVRLPYATRVCDEINSRQRPIFTAKSRSLKMSPKFTQAPQPVLIIHRTRISFVSSADLCRTSSKQFSGYECSFDVTMSNSIDVTELVSLSRTAVDVSLFARHQFDTLVRLSSCHFPTPTHSLTHARTHARTYIPQPSFFCFRINGLKSCVFYIAG